LFPNFYPNTFELTDGLETVRRFRKFEAECGYCERLPIIGMSANSDDETRKASIEVGMDNFIAKPFSMERFKNIFNSIQENIEL
jgi:CheY-like chemotaxis protein